MTIYKTRYKVKSFKSVDISPDELMDKLGDDFSYPAGDPLAAEWVMPSGRLYNAYFDNNEGAVPDISLWLSHLVLSPDAYAELKNDLEECVEFLPVDIDGEIWQIAHVVKVSDAIDLDNSEQDVEDGVVMGVESLVFDESKLSDDLLFVTDFDRRAAVYCTDRFKDLIEESGFLGPLFREDLVAGV